MDNASLIEQCSAGSKEAMESLYCSYSRRMMRVIHRYVTDSKCAEDILHDGFVLIFTHISEVRQPERLEFWMGTIMKNLCLNYLSTLDVMTMLDDDIEMPEIPDLEDILSYEELEQLINRLPDGYRTVFKLAVFEGKSHKEIGRILGISPNSSSSQLFHAKALLRKLITERRRQAELIALALLVAIGGFTVLYRSDIPDKNMEIVQTEVPEIEERFSEILAEAAIPECRETVQIRKKYEVSENRTAETMEIVADLDSVSAEDTLVAEADSDCVVTQVETGPVRQTMFDIPRKAVANARWTIGAHYTVGAQPPTVVGADYVDRAPIFSTMDGTAGNFVPSDKMPLPEPSLYHETDYELPLTFGVSVSKKITSRLSLETGLNYTYMHATLRYTSLNMSQSVKSNFIGIPLKVSYTFYSKKGLSFYGTGGASVDFPIGMHTRTTGTSAYPVAVSLPELKSRTEFSTHGGIGLHYSLTPVIGVYIEPSVRHYFRNGASAPSYWQEHRTLISVPIGIKINL